MELLPQESLQFFTRHRFNKKNLKDITNVVEETRSSFVEMIKESNVLKENKQKAVQKVENIKTMIGYSEGNKVSGNSSHSVSGIIKQKINYNILSSSFLHHLSPFLH